MVSAKSQSDDVVESLGLGANDYVTKPVDIAVAVARINSQLEVRPEKPHRSRYQDGAWKRRPKS